MDLEYFVLCANLVQSGNELLLEDDCLSETAAALSHSLLHASNLDIEQCEISQLIDLSLIILDSVQNVEWNQLTNKLVCLLSLDADDSLVVDLFPLDHLPVVNASCQQNGVHDLAQNKLNDLIFELLGN